MPPLGVWRCCHSHQPREAHQPHPLKGEVSGAVKGQCPRPCWLVRAVSSDGLALLSRPHQGFQTEEGGTEIAHVFRVWGVCFQCQGGGLRAVSVPKTLPRAEDSSPAQPSHIPELKGLAWRLGNLGAEGRTSVLAEDSGSGEAHSRTRVPPWEPGKTEASQGRVIQLRLVHSGKQN